MAKPNVYVTRFIPEETLNLLRERCVVEMNPSSLFLPKGELLAKIEGRDALIVCSTRIDDEICRAIEGHCRILANYGVGYDNIDVAAATKHGIFVSNTPDVVTEATADLAWALLLAAARRVPECDRYVRSGGKDWGLTNLMGAQVSGKTIGIIGGGRIGLAVGRRAGGFNMKILYTDVKANPAFQEATGGNFVDKETLLREADFISLHIPMLPSTRRYMGAGDFKKMKKTAVLVNTSRGPVVDEAALIEALRRGEIAAAGLDVYEGEPELKPGLADLPNVVLSPHVGTSTLDTRIKMGEVCARNIFAALDSQIPPTCLNPEAEANRRR